MGPSGDETDSVRERIGAKVFDEFVAQANLDMERSILRGPTDNNEVENMFALGWNPEAVMQVAERRAAKSEIRLFDSTERSDGGGVVYAMLCQCAS